MRQWLCSGSREAGPPLRSPPLPCPAASPPGLDHAGAAQALERRAAGEGARRWVGGGCVRGSWRQDGHVIREPALRAPRGCAPRRPSPRGPSPRRPCPPAQPSAAAPQASARPTGRAWASSWRRRWRGRGSAGAPPSGCTSQVPPALPCFQLSVLTHSCRPRPACCQPPRVPCLRGAARGWRSGPRARRRRSPRPRSLPLAPPRRPQPGRRAGPAGGLRPEAAVPAGGGHCGGVWRAAGAPPACLMGRNVARGAPWPAVCCGVRCARPAAVDRCRALRLPAPVLLAYSMQHPTLRRSATARSRATTAPWCPTPGRW